MLIRPDWQYRLVARWQAQSPVAAAPKATAPAQGGEKREMACQSLCLHCDARTPCVLGRLIG
jgi:hypothetical protein